MVVPGSIPNMILSSANGFCCYFVLVQALSNKTKQLLLGSAKILILVLALYFVVSRIQDSTIKTDVASLYAHFSATSIVLLLGLTIINWGLEVVKWQTLVGHFKDISISSSVKQVLTAHIVGLITPAKTGGYGAKALYYQSKKRKQILFLNLIGNLYQMLATLIFGLLGLGYFGFSINVIAIAIWFVTVLLVILGISFFFKFLNRSPWNIRGYSYKKMKDYYYSIGHNLRARVALLSFLRFLVFTHQCYFLTQLLYIDIAYGMAVSLIAAIYLLSSLLPVMQLLDIVARSGVAVWVFSWVGVSATPIVLTMLVMWLLNVVLPLGPGAYFLARFKLLTNTEPAQ